MDELEVNMKLRKIDRFQLFLVRSGITLALAALFIVPTVGLIFAFDSLCKAKFGAEASSGILRSCKMPDGTLKSLF